MSEAATNGAPVKKQLILNAFVESCRSSLPSQETLANIVQAVGISRLVYGDIPMINPLVLTRFNIGSSSLSCWRRANSMAFSSLMFW